MPDHEFQLKMSAREIYKTIMVHFKMTLVRITQELLEAIYSYIRARNGPYISKLSLKSNVKTSNS